MSLEEVLGEKPPKKSQLADFFEVLCTAFPTIPFSKAKLSTVVSPLWGTTDDQIHLAIHELGRRSSIVGIGYPLVVENGLVYLKRSGSMYESLMLLSLVVRVSSYRKMLDDPEKKFELLTERCLINFFGNRTKSVNFGFPSTIGRPREFGEAVKWLAEVIGLQPGHGYRPPSRKDGGVDIVVWKDFADHRAGVPILLVQATLQHDISAKARDVDRRVWASWLRMDIDPLIALAVPHALENSESWNQVSVNSLILDRIRLSSLIDDQPTDVLFGIDALRDQISNDLRELVL